MRCAAIIAAVLLCGCESFRPTEEARMSPDGTLVIIRKGGILTNIDTDASVVHEWEGNDGVMHMITWESKAEVSSDPQNRAIETMAETIDKLAAK